MIVIKKNKLLQHYQAESKNARSKFMVQANYFFIENDPKAKL